MTTGLPESSLPQPDATGPHPAIAPPPPSAPAGLTRDEMGGLLGRVQLVDWLVLVVAATQLAVDALAAAAVPRVSLGAVVALAAFNIWVRTDRFPLPDPAHRIAGSVMVTGAFVTLVALQSGGPASPLVNLYLAPLLLTAATLRPRFTWATFGLVVLGYVLLAWVAQSGSVDWPAALASGVGRLAPLAVVVYLVQRLAGAVTGIRRRLKEVTEFDDLTGLINRRAFEEVWLREHAAAESANAPYSLLLVDLDQLRKINEGHGRAAGDAALLGLASAIQRSIRAGDVAARYGDDEFAVMLPGASPQVGDAVAQRIRNSFYASLFQAGGRAQRGTAGVGAAHFPRDGRSTDKLLLMAQKRTREDKELRRKPAEGDPAPG